MDSLASADYLTATMPQSMLLKVQLDYLKYTLECAQNIGAASSGKQTMQLPAAGLQSGALATLLAQRQAAQRNASRVIQRRVVEVVQPIAAEVSAANSCIDNSAANGVSNTSAPHGSEGGLATELKEERHTDLDIDLDKL